MADFDLPHLHFVAFRWGDPFQFPSDLWHQKTRVPGFVGDAVCVVLHLAILIQYRLVMDGQTDTGSQHILHQHSVARSNDNKTQNLYC